MRVCETSMSVRACAWKQLFWLALYIKVLFYQYVVGFILFEKERESLIFLQKWLNMQLISFVYFLYNYCIFCVEYIRYVSKSLN